ncbi:unnamed protein product [Cuscuta campestris]|uniref:Receptor-like serine/threonine-protein kinase n=1 Tax=Cuscuta campestris TaxID=132261 RepID=A0A484MLQ8_9ASTE|nr:unnamed protein product [Cuscuta campestris]
MRGAGNGKRRCYPLLFLRYILIIIITHNFAASLAVDTITPAKPLSGNQTLVSSDGIFELGFFTPGGSGKFYVGIWYKQIRDKTVVWVANRDAPLPGSDGILKIGEDGNLYLLAENGGNSTWSSSSQPAAEKKKTVAQLLDSGNLVLRQENDGEYLWQSFDYPTDTMLPGMKLGWDSKSGLTRYITSWKSSDDPSEGSFTFKLDTGDLPECFLRDGDKVVYRSGPWNGLRFSGVPEMKPTKIITFSFSLTNESNFYTFELHNKFLYSRLMVSSAGLLERYTWVPTSKIWSRFWYAPRDQCDGYRGCGAFGYCDTNMSPVCRCPPGFRPRNQQAWDLRDGSAGCIRKDELDCGRDGFIEMKYMKLPDTSDCFVDKRMDLKACKEMCRRNCSCTAFTNSNVSNGGSGCVIWTAELFDMRRYAAVEGGQVLYIRVAVSDVERGGGDDGSRDASKKTLPVILACGVTVGVGLVLLAVMLTLLFLSRRKQSRRVTMRTADMRSSRDRSQDLLTNAAAIPGVREFSGEAMTAEDFDLPLFDFSAIVMATNNFADANKLGQGGFGCVYKGMVIEGQEIAVKRLSKNSGQGVEEFMNELRLIAKLQHRNLVRLLGCCVDMEEKILIYEYMENKSLDSTLFNKQKSSLLNWQTRFNIICGIARGLLYLHQDSRFRIIHRDLKASNILLDKEMKPKISDFGMARIFGGDETEANNTKRVVGTYGYMSPEYAMDGLFSVKSDVFSFGVLVLEIVTGKKNRGFYNQNNQQNLLGHAWTLWREGRWPELLDSTIGEMYSHCEAMRCIQVGLLCVQEGAEDRPNMATVVLMLSSESATLPQPKNPGFCLGRRPDDMDSCTSNNYDESCTVNQVTVTILDGR